jgi:ATP-dependent Lhr-like helicase
VSRVTCVPSHALEFVEAAAARRAALAGRIESRRPWSARSISSRSISSPSRRARASRPRHEAEVRSTARLPRLTDAEWHWALDFVTRGGDALKAYPEYHKVERGEDGIYRVPDAAIARATACRSAPSSRTPR